MEYLWAYVAFGAMFLVGTGGYWGVSRLFNDPSKTYVTKAQAPRAKN